MAHIVSAVAAAELDAIWHYIVTESGNPEVGDRVLQMFTDRFQLLAAHPHLGRKLGLPFRADLRRFPVAAFVILYTTRNGRVTILRVVHGRRDLDSIQMD